MSTQNETSTSNPNQNFKDVDCEALKLEYSSCTSLQYDRWLHPKKHNKPPNYDECKLLFESWKKCVLNKRKGT